jgi:hypothetical protein
VCFTRLELGGYSGIVLSAYDIKTSITQPSMLTCAYNTNPEFQARLGCIMRPCLKKTKQNKQTENHKAKQQKNLA